MQARKQLPGRNLFKLRAHSFPLAVEVAELRVRPKSRASGFSWASPLFLLKCQELLLRVQMTGEYQNTDQGLHDITIGVLQAAIILDRLIRHRLQLYDPLQQRTQALLFVEKLFEDGHLRLSISIPSGRLRFESGHL